MISAVFRIVCSQLSGEGSPGSSSHWGDAVVIWCHILMGTGSLFLGGLALRDWDLAWKKALNGLLAVTELVRGRC